MPVELTIAHSPDPDDAFMWWPLQALEGRPPAIDTGRFRFRAVAEDIEVLNQRAEHGLHEITAMSCAHWARVAGRYVLTACGASVGDGYGPKLVAREAMRLEALRREDAVIAVPGTRTTAFLVASLLLGPGRFVHEVVPFDRIIDEVAAGRFAAGVVIHEGQLTYERGGLVLLEDLGRWWSARTGLPLPLGANAVRRDLDELHGPGTIAEVTRLLTASVAHAMAHRDEAVRHAMRFARGLDAETADRFVAMYVNHWTLDYGPRGRAAVERLLAEAASAGLVPRVPAVDMVGA